MWLDVDRAERFLDGELRCVAYEDEQILVVRLDGELYAVSNVCTHDYALLSEGSLEGEEIVCPLHGACFSVRSGEALTPPAYDDLDTFPVRVEDGMVQVEVEE